MNIRARDVQVAALKALHKKGALDNDGDRLDDTVYLLLRQLQGLLGVTPEQIAQARKGGYRSERDRMKSGIAFSQNIPVEVLRTIANRAFLLRRSGPDIPMPMGILVGTDYKVMISLRGVKHETPYYVGPHILSACFENDRRLHFTRHYDSSLDDKGRIFVPSRVRAKVEDRYDFLRGTGAYDDEQNLFFFVISRDEAASHVELTDALGLRLKGIDATTHYTPDRELDHQGRLNPDTYVKQQLGFPNSNRIKWEPSADKLSFVLRPYRRESS